MTQQELYLHLKELGIPIAYSHFTKSPTVPYMAYYFSNSDDFIADDTNYKEIEDFIVELYTEKKDLETEKILEDKLKELELIYSKSEVWIQSERLYQINYTIQLF